MRESGAELLQIDPAVIPDPPSKIDDREEHDQKQVEGDDREYGVPHA
jgi:hypothetical protein